MYKIDHTHLYMPFFKTANTNNPMTYSLAYPTEQSLTTAYLFTYQIDVATKIGWALFSFFRCEPFDTYPRSYDLLHAHGLFSSEQKRYAPFTIKQPSIEVFGDRSCMLLRLSWKMNVWYGLGEVLHKNGPQN